MPPGRSCRPVSPHTSRPARHTVFDDVQAVPASERERRVEIRRHPERVLHHEHSGFRRYTALSVVEIHIVIVQTAIDIHWPRARVADRIGDHDMRRCLEQHLVAVTDIQCAKQSIKSNPPGGEAGRISDADLLRKGLLVLFDYRSPDYVAVIGHVPQRQQAIAERVVPPTRARRRAGITDSYTAAYQAPPSSKAAMPSSPPPRLSPATFRPWRGRSPGAAARGNSSGTSALAPHPIAP